MKHSIVLILLLFTTSLFASQHNETMAKKSAVKDFRQHFSKKAYRGHQLTKKKTEQITPQQCIILLREDGKFTDLVEIQEKIEKQQMNLKKSTNPQNIVSELLETSFNRIWRIAELYREKPYNEYAKDKTVAKLYKAINNYSKIEADRGNITSGRFHISCFAIPTAAVNTYFSIFDAMEHIERGNEKNETAILANENLKKMSYQSWTQPYRNDVTDKNPVSVERFQKHVWWVGGNGLGFRSLLPTAAAMSSVEMMNVLAIVAKGGLTAVSQNTYDDAFWTEGFTADGAGWGHGMQCLIWGYPISGASAALNLMNYFKETPWAKQLDDENAQALLNYFRGSAWFYYKGYIPRALGRGSMDYSEFGKEKIKTKSMVKTAIDDWFTSYSKSEQKELLDLQNETKGYQITMQDYPEGYYTGTRWFFNNDNLIKKNPNYYILVSMASVRCDGIESFKDKADKFNFFTCDGMTHFMKEGNEYHKAIGAWNLTAVPGVTARQGEDKLTPITNWRGYCSKHNFAAAATSGSKNAACGFIFEKMNASDKEGVNDTTGSEDPNKIIYGVKAHKAYFMVDDYMFALGAGITNLNPEIDGDVWTTIDQTNFTQNVNYYSNGKEIKKQDYISEMLEDKELVWASQKAGFSYAVLPKHTTGEVFLSTENRPTKWEKINATNKNRKNLTKETDIFQMHINHGKDIKNGTYAYVVYAGEEKASKAFLKMPLNIIENTTDIQAISWGEKYIGASFYNSKKPLKEKKWAMMVSSPCALLLEKSENGWKLSVTDAEMKKDLKTIEVRTTLPIGGKNVVKEGKWNVVSIPMPQADLTGKPATVELSMN